jgi:hypothetical protein
MKRNLALSALLFLPMVASADTVIMRDGRTYDGTFISGNSRQITLVDRSGVRRQMQVSDIQELRFGSGSVNNDYRNSSRNRTVDNGSVFGSNNGSYNSNTTTVDEAGMLSRIREDLRSAMYNSNLTSDQRSTLEDTRRVLDRASNDSRNGYTVNYRDVRSALMNVRSLLNSDAFSAADRDRLLSDFDQLRAMRADYYDRERDRDRDNR